MGGVTATALFDKKEERSTIFPTIDAALFGGAAGLFFSEHLSNNFSNLCSYFSFPTKKQSHWSEFQEQRTREHSLQSSQTEFNVD